MQTTEEESAELFSGIQGMVGEMVNRASQTAGRILSQVKDEAVKLKDDPVGYASSIKTQYLLTLERNEAREKANTIVYSVESYIKALTGTLEDLTKGWASLQKRQVPNLNPEAVQAELQKLAKMLEDLQPLQSAIMLKNREINDDCNQKFAQAFDELQALEKICQERANDFSQAKEKNFDALKTWRMRAKAWEDECKKEQANAAADRFAKPKCKT